MLHAQHVSSVKWHLSRFGNIGAGRPHQIVNIMLRVQHRYIHSPDFPFRVRYHNISSRVPRSHQQKWCFSWRLDGSLCGPIFSFRVASIALLAFRKWLSETLCTSANTPSRGKFTDPLCISTFRGTSWRIVTRRLSMSIHRLLHVSACGCSLHKCNAHAN